MDSSSNTASFGGGSSSSESNYSGGSISPPISEQQPAAEMNAMPLGFNFFNSLGMEQQKPVSATSFQNAQLQLLEALAKAGLLPPLPPPPTAAAPPTGGRPVNVSAAAAFDCNNNSLLATNKFSSNGMYNQNQTDQKQHSQRKRRRMNGNLDNTLDGLVAKRVDQTPLKRRYQTETEAIELPDDEVEIKRMEADPDVCTRMCSVCGYQGKWVSEMIRHKRVHTNDRPFKCKFCNRTSKWKADLIRHVAKTHGIRVVSKYSRSKAFEAGSGKSQQPGPTVDDVLVNLLAGACPGDGINANNAFNTSCGSECGSSVSAGSSASAVLLEDENHNNFVGIAEEDNGNDNNKNDVNSAADHLNSVYRKRQRLDSLSRGNGNQQIGPTKTSLVPQQASLIGTANLNALLGGNAQKQQRQNAPPAPYKCGSCIYEQTSFPMLVSHLLAVHKISPFVCQLCNRAFNELVSAGEHFAAGQCPPWALKANFIMQSPSAQVELKGQQPQQPMMANNNGNNGMINPLNLLSSLMPTSSAASAFLPPKAFGQIGAGTAGGLFGSSPVASAVLAGFPSLFSALQVNAVSQNACTSPASILSTAGSHGSLNSLFNQNKGAQDKNNGDEADEEEEEEFGKKSPQFDVTSTAPTSTPSGKNCCWADSRNIASSPMEAATKEESATNTKVEVDEDQQHQEKQLAMAAAQMLLNAMEQLNNGSAFKPIVQQRKEHQPQLPIGLNSAAISSLAAFGQILAELQRHSSVAGQQQQQQKAFTAIH